jgi:signal transduction histidine kinase
MEQKAKLLIVDDEADIVFFLKDFLLFEGYAIITASSGKEALDRIEKDHPDLVLLDVNMPEMDGYQVCRKIRDDCTTALLPVVMLTGARGEERVKGIEAGADDFLIKPVNQPEVIARVRSLLRIKELHNAVQMQATQLAKWNKQLQTKLEHESKLAAVALSLGDMGDDIKKMVMPILNGAWLLQDELSEHFTNLPDSPDKKAKSSQELSNEIINMVRNNAQRIQDQVRDIADCVKNLSSPPQFSLCQFVDIANQVTQTLRFLAKEKGITLQTEGLEDLPPLQADGSRLFQAFYILVNNAISEVMQEGSITLQGITDPDAKTICISVIDTGRGMTPEIRDSLFTQHVVSRKASGTGLGTKIVKDTIDAHGGQINVESELDVGTTFHIRLPVGGPTASPVSPS